jgi:hypothetical protein
MKTTINFCGNCPFAYSDYDDFAVGYSTMDICTLSRFLNREDDCISIHDGMGPDYLAPTPDWCPLKEEEYSFDFKEFSPERLQEISDVKNEIKELEEFFDMREDEVDYDDPIIIEKNDKTQQLYSKLQELQSNEEIYTEFEEDITEQLDKIKEQILSLEDVSNKLKETFNNLGL